jgi:hypothetical protein
VWIQRKNDDEPSAISPEKVITQGFFVAYSEVDLKKQSRDFESITEKFEG